MHNEATKEQAELGKLPPAVDLGIAGWRVPLHSHIACLCENEEQVAQALGFASAGLRSSDHCVLLGDAADHQLMLGILERQGVDVAGAQAAGRLTLVGRGSSAQAMLHGVTAAFAAALAAGARVLRLSGIVGWDRELQAPDAELFAFEALLTEFAKRWPCVILCLHEVQSMSGPTVRHGALGTHPEVLAPGGVLANPYFVPLSGAPERLTAIKAELSRRQQAREALRQKSEELRALSARLRVAREEESTRIAREVHDEIGQMLTALRLDVAWLERQLDSPSSPQREAVGGKLDDMSHLLDLASDAVYRVISELRPGILDELGLEAAVEWHVGEFEKRTGIPCRLASDMSEVDLSPDHATALFRILQEALTNVARHAGATAVDIRLAAEARRVTLEIVDNGGGIPEEKIGDSRSIGLVGMRERARSLGGGLTVRPHSPHGTTVEVSLPL
jgi:signal transduction histidine kinase